MQRTKEDVEILIEKAKIDINGLSKVSQTLISGENMIVDDKSMILLELNPTLLESLKLGQEFTIRGDSNEHAVLCTKNQTFDLEEAQTSNSLLALPSFDLPNSIEESNLTDRITINQEVTKIFHFYYEVKKCKPRLAKLRKLLEENPYRGPEYDEDIGEKFNLDDLLNLIQASEEELIKGLNHLNAFQIDGFYRVLDYDYKCRVVNFIFNLIDSNSYPINEIPKSIILDTLEELVPREVIEPCFEMYAEPASNRSEEGLYQLKENNVCQFFAEILLRSAGKFHLEEFLESWQKSVPEGLTTRLTQLQGLALTDKQSKPEVIFYYPVWNLPEDITERFDTLFRKRANWAYEDIKPYVEDLVTESLNVNALLTKYARGSVQKGIKMYNSKHPIK